MIKDELGGNMMTESVTLRAKINTNRKLDHLAQDLREL